MQDAARAPRTRRRLTYLTTHFTHYYGYSVLLYSTLYTSSRCLLTPDFAYGPHGIGWLVPKNPGFSGK